MDAYTQAVAIGLALGAMWFLTWLSLRIGRQAEATPKAEPVTEFDEMRACCTELCWRTGRPVAGRIHDDGTWTLSVGKPLEMGEG